MTPVDKRGEETDLLNYRSMSTMSALTQIYEKRICKHLVRPLEKEKILYEFTKGRSTSQVIIEISENFRKAIDNKMYSCGVFLDFSKAFDTVNHKTLFSKLEVMGDYRFNFLRVISLIEDITLP